MGKLNATVLLALAVAIPMALAFGLRHVPPLRTLPEPAAHIGSRFPDSPVPFGRREIGPPVEHYPLVTNVQILDFDDDGRSDILACDARRQCVVLCSRDAAGRWKEKVLAEDIAARQPILFYAPFHGVFHVVPITQPIALDHMQRL